MGKVQKLTWIKFLSNLKYTIMGMSVESLKDSDFDALENSFSEVLKEINAEEIQEGQEGQEEGQEG